MTRILSILLSYKVYFSNVLPIKAERNEVLQAVRAQEMMEKHREAHRW